MSTDVCCRRHVTVEELYESHIHFSVSNVNFSTWGDSTSVQVVPLRFVELLIYHQKKNTPNSSLCANIRVCRSKLIIPSHQDASIAEPIKPSALRSPSNYQVHHLPGPLHRIIRWLEVIKLCAIINDSWVVRSNRNVPYCLLGTLPVIALAFRHFN